MVQFVLPCSYCERLVDLTADTHGEARAVIAAWIDRVGLVRCPECDKPTKAVTV